MENWHEKYKNKIVSAAEALKVVKSGNRVVIGHACGEPPALVEALVNRAPELSNVEIVHMVAMGPAKYAQPGMEASFRHNALFVGGSTRKPAGRARSSTSGKPSASSSKSSSDSGRDRTAKSRIG